MTAIDFNSMGMPVFTGRPRGEAARRKYRLDDLDSAKESVEVIIPDEVYTITSSYFLGLFGPSIRNYGSKSDFIAHYNFQAPERVMGRLDEWVDRALREKGRI